MVLYFKLDKENRLYLMRCTELKTRNLDKTNLKTSDYNASDIENTRAPSPVFKYTKTMYKDKKVIENQFDVYNEKNIPRDNREQKTCIVCLKERTLNEVKLKFIIAWKSMGSDDKKELERILRRYWGKNEVEKFKFEILQNDKNWVNKATKVCDSCYMKITDSYNPSL